MSVSEPDFAPVLAVYSGDCQPRRGELLAGAGGFSGAKVWRLETDRGPLCLRRWPPESPNAERLRYIHRVLMAVDAAGFRRIPLPIANLRGETFVEFDDHRWELSPWLPGSCDQPNQWSRPSSPARVEAALTALAEFHRAAERADGFRTFGVAPGLLSRAEQLRRLLAGGIDELARQIDLNQMRWPELAERSRPLMESFRRAAPTVGNSLVEQTALKVPIQPCIRDIYRDHLLFVGDQVAGIIDFGSMKPDSSACDVARLLGSMALDEPRLWREGLVAYERVCPLSVADRRLVVTYDQSAVLLSGTNWLQWVFGEGRQFDDRERALQRFDLVSQRLSRLASITPRW